MKILGFVILIGGGCLLASTSAYAQRLLLPAATSAPSVQPIAYDDAPMPGHKHGGRKGKGGAKSVAPGVPAMNGATREGADQEYKKKYGF